jgi:hypothetical protein
MEGRQGTRRSNQQRVISSQPSKEEDTGKSAGATQDQET